MRSILTLSLRPHERHLMVDENSLKKCQDCYKLRKTEIQMSFAIEVKKF